MEAKVMLAIPSYKSCPAHAFQSIVMAILENINKGLLKRIGMKTFLYVTQARNELAKTAIEAYHRGEITHVWWVDDDMMLPEGCLERLLSYDEPAVSGLYYGRGLQPIAYELEPFRYLRRDEILRKGLLQVDGVGFGCFLLRADILDAVAINYGSYMFQTPVREKEDGSRAEMGEDVFFCQLLKEMDVPIYVDCGLVVPHVGDVAINRVLAEVVDAEEGMFVRGVKE